MRLFKLVFLSIIFLVALITGISLFIPSHIRLSKAINLSPDQDSIFIYIEQPKEWRKWYPALMDFSENSFENLDQSTTRIMDNTIRVLEKNDDEVITELKKEDGRPIISGFKLIRHVPEDSLTLQWYMDFNLRWYPWEKFRSLFYEDIYGVQMEQGLSNLRQLNSDAIRQ